MPKRSRVPARKPVLEEKRVADGSSRLPGAPSRACQFLVRHAWTLIFLLGVAVLGLPIPEADPDLWGHVRFGMDYIRAGRLLTTDPYSFTAGDALWFHHDWLGEVLLGGAWMTIGPSGLWWLRLAAIACMLLAITRHCAATCRRVLPGLVIFAVSWNLLAAGLAYRPQLATLVLFSVVVYLVRAVRDGRLRSWVWPAVFPPLFALWANLHGGWPAGLAVLLLAARCEVPAALRCTDSAKPWRGGAAILAVAASAAATLANPHGLVLWERIWQDQSVSRGGTITEWMPTELFLRQFPYVNPEHLPLALLFAAGVAAFLRAPRVWTSFEIILLAGLAGMTLQHVRHSVLFAIAAVMILPKYFDDEAGSLGTEDDADGKSLPPSLAAGGTLLAAAAVAAWLFPELGRPVVRESDYPMAAIRFLKENNIRGNLAVHFNWSQFAIWHLGGDPVCGTEPVCRVAYDGRHRSLYSLELERDAFAFAGIRPGAVGERAWGVLLSDHAVDIVLMPAAWHHLDAMRQRPGWRELHPHQLQRTAVLFVRTDAFPALPRNLGTFEAHSPAAKSSFEFP